MATTSKKQIELDLSKFIKKVEKALDATLAANTFKKFADEIVAMIVERVQRGYGLNKNLANLSRLKPLSRSYVEFRQKNSRKLAATTDPKKSNATFSGQMLDSIKVLKSSKGSVVIGPSGTRKGGGNNRSVGFYYSEVRPFLYLSNSEHTKFTQLYRQELLSAVRKQRLTIK